MSIQRRDWLKFAAAAALSTAMSPLSRLGASEPKALKNILLISGWQDINIGDITHTTGLLRILESRFPEAKIVLWKSSLKDPDSPAVTMIRKYFPQVEVIGGSVDRATFEIRGERVLRAVEEADLFLHGSGPSVVRWDALAAWMKRTGKPFGIFGTTIQHVTPQLKPVLEKAAFIFTRESASIDVLKKHGFEGGRIRFVPDATFALDTRDEESAQKFLEERKLEDRKFLCVVPRLRWTPYPGRLEREPEKRRTNEKWKEIDHAKARQAMIAWVEKTRQPVLVCPEMTYQVDIMDELLLDPLPEAIKPFVQKRGYWMPDEAAAVYAKAHSVLSFECHSPIIATAMGTPAFYLRQPEDTIKGQMYYDLGQDDWTFEIEETPGDRIAARLMDVVADYPAALERVVRVNETTRRIYDDAKSVILQRLS